MSDAGITVIQTMYIYIERNLSIKIISVVLYILLDELIKKYVSNILDVKF